jgi:hypothetical protein
MRREASPDSRGAVYILVHLHDLEIEDSLVHEPGRWEWHPDYRYFCDAVHDAVEDVSSRCARRILVSDDATSAEYAAECWTPIGGRGGWEPTTIDVANVSRVAALPAPGARVIIAGYARQDCVTRAAAACERRGFEVVLHDVAVLPLTGAAVDALARQVDAATRQHPGASYGYRRSRGESDNGAIFF